MTNSYGQQLPPATPSHASGLRVEILSDTQGADISPYIRTIVSDIRSHWLPLVAKASVQTPSGADDTIISFSIAPNGQVSAMKMEHSTQNAALDKAAWNATQSAHYSPLPSGMEDSPLKVRILFPSH
jgi:TonB family protein